MLKRSLILLLLLTLHAGPAATAAGGQSADARREFTPVQGANLSARMGAARKLADARPQKTPYWLAYSFDVRPGVSVDLYQEGAGNAAGGWPVKPAVPKGNEATRNLGVFLLYEPTGESVARVEVYNLDRQRDYGGHQVYWLGASRADESLNLLRALVKERQVRKVAEPAVTAIALHNDARAASVLEDVARHSTYERARTMAIFWLGQFDGQQPFLAALVGNDEESTEVRKQAAFSIGVGRDKGALDALQGLYGPVGNREVKKQIIFAASVSEPQDKALDFLINVAQTEADRELRKLAIFWLGSKAAERVPAGAREGGQSVFGEMQGQTIFAISRRPAEEATPLLSKIATTHPNVAVRQEAMFWLGQINGEQALKVFREVLKK